MVVLCFRLSAFVLPFGRTWPFGLGQFNGLDDGLDALFLLFLLRLFLFRHVAILVALGERHMSIGAWRVSHTPERPQESMLTSTNPSEEKKLAQ